MPRIARKSIKSEYIHVITQGIKKEYIFKKDMYKNEYIKLLRETIEMKNYKELHILAYCVMDNHAHLLIHTKDIKKLSGVMSKVNTSYGIFYNKTENRVGYVFRNRYYSQEIMDEKHLYNTIVYIHNNPVKANMVEKMSDYKFSSYNKMKKGEVSDETIELLFHTKKYLKKFEMIHKEYKGENIFEVENLCVSDEKINKVIKEFCDKNKLTMQEVRKNNAMLKEIVGKIKENYAITNKRISEILKIGKNRITQINKKGF